MESAMIASATPALAGGSGDAHSPLHVPVIATAKARPRHMNHGAPMSRFRELKLWRRLGESLGSGKFDCDTGVLWINQ